MLYPSEGSSPVVLPELGWKQSGGCGARNGAKVTRVVVHRWGDRYTNEKAEASTYQGVINYLCDRANSASAHIVFPGSAVPGKATQLVRWDDYAWAEAAYNPTSDEIESADAIWVGNDTEGMRVLARIVAFRLHIRGLPAVWSHDHGFCRHADLGAAGGGHTACPTTDIAQWKTFVGMVQHEAARGGLRKEWGR